MTPAPLLTPKNLRFFGDPAVRAAANGIFFAFGEEKALVIPAQIAICVMRQHYAIWGKGPRAGPVCPFLALPTAERANGEDPAKSTDDRPKQDVKQ